jgi:hypothetical protein
MDELVAAAATTSLEKFDRAAAAIRVQLEAQRTAQMQQEALAEVGAARKRHAGGGHG